MALLQTFEGNLEKISLQKLLFLFTSRQSKPEYDFVPFHYGCYSFSANADLTAMVKHGLVTENTTSIAKADKVNYTTSLTSDDKKILLEIHNIYGKLSANALMKLTYLNYQYYAINSKKAKEILTEEQYQRVIAAKPENSDTTLFTIGYESVSLEAYLNKLIKNDVKVLVDVRNNPVSMKYGFSKNQLSKFCESLNIEYLHIPELGIQSEQRQQLDTQSDYDRLFDVYKTKNLKSTTSYQKELLNLLIEKKRIALTCFEANICQCHRKHLAEAITQLPEFKFNFKHI
jgi:uncharacterized protein (DUF488 family)